MLGGESARKCFKSCAFIAICRRILASLLKGEHAAGIERRRGV